jgi:oligogalacturonide lyase
MKSIKILLAIVTLFCSSCKEKQSATSYNDKNTTNVRKISVLETSKESSFAKVWIDSETGHKIENLVDRKGDNKSFYFHNSPFLPTKNKNGKRIIFRANFEGNSQIYAVEIDKAKQ